MDCDTWLKAEITPDEMQTIDATNAPMLNAALCTDPIEAAVSFAAINAVYAARNLPSPEYVLCSSPLDAMRKIEAEAPDEEQGKTVLGEAVDMVFHGETFEVYQRTASESRWTHKMERRVERALFPVMQLSHAVDEALETAFSDKPVYWVNYAGANWSLWDSAMDLAQDEAAVSLGVKNPAYFSQERALGGAALKTCGGVYAFERKCLVYDRPVSIAHPKLVKDAAPGVVALRWRDGFACEMAM